MLNRHLRETCVLEIACATLHCLPSAAIAHCNHVVRKHAATMCLQAVHRAENERSLGTRLCAPLIWCVRFSKVAVVGRAAAVSKLLHQRRHPLISMQLAHQSSVGLDQGIEVCSRALSATEKGCLHAECCTNTSRLSTDLTSLLHEVLAQLLPKICKATHHFFGAPLPRCLRELLYLPGTFDTSLLLAEPLLITRISNTKFAAL
jgi:hypothetical protein